MKKLPIGIQVFSNLINGDYLYIDKTREIFNLLQGKYYFISRPRRFGKSLLISTLQEIFNGNKELFKGLWIYDKIPWTPSPVIHFDFSLLSFDTPRKLEAELDLKLRKVAAQHGVTLNDERDCKGKFEDLLEKMGEKEPVVILIDEYDKPIIDCIDDIETATANRKILKHFYSTLKGAGKFIRFVCITGVSKFSRVSIFSGLNNLNDITIDDNFSTIMGYTQEEVLHYFKPYIEQLGKKMKLPQPVILENLKRWYNGYSWDGDIFLYNPFSLLNLFTKYRFSNYWFATGTPTFLVNHVKKRVKNIESLETTEVDESIFESYDIENLEPVSLLFQTGYLTIKEITYIGVKPKYVLSYPNNEVKESFLGLL